MMINIGHLVNTLRKAEPETVMVAINSIKEKRRIKKHLFVSSLIGLKLEDSVRGFELQLSSQRDLVITDLR